MTLETELKLRQANELELKLSKSLSDFEMKSLALKTVEKEANE